MSSDKNFKSLKFMILGIIYFILGIICICISLYLRTVQMIYLGLIFFVISFLQFWLSYKNQNRDNPLLIKIINGIRKEKKQKRNDEKKQRKELKEQFKNRQAEIEKEFAFLEDDDEDIEDDFI